MNSCVCLDHPFLPSGHAQSKEYVLVYEVGWLPFILVLRQLQATHSDLPSLAHAASLLTPSAAARHDCGIIAALPGNGQDQQPGLGKDSGGHEQQVGLGFDNCCLR
jgi:hypothetical protein